MTDRTARRIATAIVTATGLLVAVFGAGHALRRQQSHVDVDRALYPVVGVDISAHNGRIDFDSVAAAGIDFIYLKASEGTSFRDSAFADNCRRAAAAGLPVGAYHFFRFDCDGRRQAMNLLAATDSMPLALPLAIDIEEWGNHAEVATDVIIGRLQAMEAMLRGAGYRVMIYTNKNGYYRFVNPSFDDVPDAPELWICSFTNPPLAHTGWRLWQHSHLSHVPGIDGEVDLNTFNGTRAQFRRWLNNTTDTRFHRRGRDLEFGDF